MHILHFVNMCWFEGGKKTLTEEKVKKAQENKNEKQDTEESSNSFGGEIKTNQETEVLNPECDN